VTDKEFEQLIGLLFGHGERDETIADQKGKNESVTDNLKYICQKHGVY